MGSSILVAAMMLSLQALGDTLVVRAVNPIGARPELQVTEELRIGSLDGPEYTSFGYVEAIAVSADGRVYIPDVQVPVIRVFDQSGNYLGDLGRDGQGPGEYLVLRGIAALRNGDIAVWHDAGDITVFDRSGEFVRRFSLKFTSMAGGPGPGLVADTLDNVFVRTTTGAIPPGPSPVIPYAWVHYSSSGEFIDSIVPPDRDLGGSPLAFRSETFSAPSPHGYFWSGRTTEYALHRPLRDGRVIRIEGDYEPIPIRGNERTQWERYVDELESRRNQRFPRMHDAKPAWKEFRVGLDGRVWLLRYSQADYIPGYLTRSSIVAGVPTVEWVEPNRYDILDPRGRLLGTAVLPRGAEILAARGQFVWARERGEYDEPYVVRYRVDGLPGAPRDQL